MTTPQTPRLAWTPIAIIAAMLAVSAWAWYVLPAEARIPVHFDLQLRPDRHGSKLEGLLALPLVATLLALAPALAHHLDPRASNLRRSREAVRVAVFALLSCLACIHIAVVGAALDWPLSLHTALALALALMFLILGNVLGKLRSNHFIGVRTPWTLADEQVWGKTHRFAGRAFVAVALVAGVLALAGAAGTASIVLCCGILGTALISVVLSWIWWRQLAAGKSS